MVKINITKREQQLLEEIIKEGMISKNMQINDFQVIICNEIKETLDQIINLISDYFISYGLLPNDEPNALGIELENLNDKFIRELQR